MSDIPFSEYGYTTDNPPVLNTTWNEQKRVVDLSKQSYVFITSLYSSPWRLRSRFPNADRSTIKYYWCKYGERRIKMSLHWIAGRGMNATGATRSTLFGTRYDFLP